MRRKLLVWALVLGLALTIMPMSASAAVTVLTVKTPATIPRAGETFSVTVDVTGNPGFNSLGLTLSYDKTAVECTRVSLGDVTAGAVSATNPSASDGARVGIASTTTLVSDGALAVFRFRSLSGGDPKIELTKAELSDANSVEVPYTVTTQKAEDPSKDVKETAPMATAGQSELVVSPRIEEQSKPVEQSAETQVQSVAAFPDAVGHWGAEWIAKAAERGLFDGYPDGSFHPDAQISRGDYVLVLWRMAGKPEPKQKTSFADVSPDAYYADAVAWAYESGYVEGKGSGFAPQDNLTRQEAMKILFGYAGSPSGLEMMLAADYDAAFVDSAQIASWAKPAMYWAYYQNIISGMGGNVLGPQAFATRAQLAKIMVGYLDKTT